MAESTAIMNGKDAISGSLGKCFVTIGNNRYNFMQAISLEASMEKTKTEVPILGKTGKGNKATGWKGTGSAKFHFNTSIFRELLQNYAKTGEDMYFDKNTGNPVNGLGIITINRGKKNNRGQSLEKYKVVSKDVMKEDDRKLAQEAVGQRG